MSTHYAVVTVDEAYAARFPTFPTEYVTRIECSDPAACPGWEECRGGDHAGFDPDDEESAAYDQYEDVEIHGVLHEWKWGYGWTVPFAGCPVAANFDGDIYELPTPLRPGKWRLEDEWDGEDVYLTVVAEVGPDGSDLIGPKQEHAR